MADFEIRLRYDIKLIGGYEEDVWKDRELPIIVDGSSVRDAEMKLSIALSMLVKNQPAPVVPE